MGPGIVETIAGSEWTVSRQKFSLGPNVAVGDRVTVEARVLAEVDDHGGSGGNSGSGDDEQIPSYDPGRSKNGSPG